METEKRKHSRTPFLTTVSLSDQIRACEADVVDVSMGGIAIERIPSVLLKDMPKIFTGIVSYRGKNVRVSLTPRWYKKDRSGMYGTIGFQVNGSTTTNWVRFISDNTCLPVPRAAVDDCVWSSVPYRG